MPSRAFKSSLLKQLRFEMKTSPMPSSSMFARYGAVGFTSLALVLGGGTGVYAYESPDVVDGHPLQVVKQNLENAEGKIADWRGQPGAFHAKMAERRLNEVERHKDKKDKVQKLLTVAANELGITLEQIQQGLRDEETRADLLTRLTASDAKVGGLIQRFVDRVNEHEADPGPRKAWLEKIGLGEEVSAIREELKNADLSNEEKQDLFREKMKVLLDAQKAKIDARRDALKAEGKSDEEVRTQLRTEFGFPPRPPMRKPGDRDGMPGRGEGFRPDGERRPMFDRQKDELEGDEQDSDDRRDPPQGGEDRQGGQQE